MDIFNKNESYNIVLEKILIAFEVQEKLNKSLSKRITELEKQLLNQKKVKDV